MIVDHLFDNKKNLQEGVTTENTQDTYNRVYQLMVRQKPEFMYHADNEDVKNAILKAMSFGSQISVNDLATYAYGLLKSNDINEQGVAETSDYSRRREREEDIISGKRPARQRTPAQTSDYARRRAQEKKSQPYNEPDWAKKLPKEKLDTLAGSRHKKEQGVAEGSESAIQKIEKKIQAKRDALGLAREQRRARGQHQQGQREIKIQAEIDRLSNELTQLKKQGVAEGSSLVDRVQQIIEKNHQDGVWTGQDLAEFIRDTYDGRIPDEEEFYDDIDALEYEDNFFNELVQVGAFKQGVAEAPAPPDADDAAQHVYANNTEVPWAVNTATGKNYTVDQLQGVTKRKRFSPSGTSTAPAAAAPTSPSVPKAPIIKYNFNLPASGTAAPASGTAAPAGGEPPATPAADQASKVGVGQINKIIPTLRTRDLTSVKKTVDATIAKKAKPAPAAGTADSGALANMANQLSGNKPNTMANAPVSKTNKAKLGNPNAAPAAPKATSVPKAPGIKYNINLPAGGGAGVKAAPVSKGTKVVSGGPTPDEQAKLARRIAQAAKQPVAEMLAMVETKEDVAKIKQFIDQTFVKHGAVNETAFAVRNQLIEHVTQVGAQRRREHSQRMAK